MKKYYRLNNQNFKNNSNIISGVTTDIEFDKWLSYESDEYKKRKLELLSLDIERLDNKQIEELKKYNEDSIYSRVINKYTYDVDSCTHKEYNAAVEYICSHSLDDLINRRISKEDKKIGDDKFNTMFLYMNKNNLLNFINNYTNQNFKDISIIDAYVYHKALNLYAKLVEQEDKKSKNSNGLIKRLLFFKKQKASC